MARYVMKHFEREVVDHDLICAMLDLMDTANVAMNDEDGWPYVVPLSFGYDADDEGITVFIHCMKAGKKVDLLRADDRVCIAFNRFNDFPDRKYKGHYHDFRSVVARGHLQLLNYQDDPQTWERGYNLLYTCNHREIKPLSERAKVPGMYIGAIRCAWDDVTAKSEFPLRTTADVPFLDPYALPEDDTPFDLTDIVEARKERRRQLKAQGWT